MRSAALLVVLVVLAGCTAPINVDSTVPDGPGVGSDRTATPGDAPRIDDGVGVQDGVRYDAAIDANASDGLDRDELSVVVARMMARLEVLRNLSFAEDVDIEVISRAEYRNRSVGFAGRDDPWRDQVYEALFLVGEDRTAATALGELYGASVAGYYYDGTIVLVSDDTPLSVDRATLVHELVHALQAQRRNLSTRGDTMDARTASTGLIEGEANHLMDEYTDRCGDEWDCIEQVPRGGNRSSPGGLFLTVFAPYSEGPAFVAALRERGGWAAVDRSYGVRPGSTEQLIHPERYPDDDPDDVTVPDRSGEEWTRFSPEGRDQQAQTVGEAALYAAFYGNGVIDEEHLYTDEVRFNYSHPITDGWGGDAVVPYRKGDRYGYVFKSTWDTREDAAEFHRAYRRLLDARGATEVRDGVYRIPEDDPYDDAVRVTRRGDTVVVVNAPTVEELAAVHAPQ